MKRIINFLCLSLLSVGAIDFGMNNSAEQLYGDQLARKLHAQRLQLDNEQLNTEQLIEAAKSGNLIEVERFIAQGVSVNAENDKGETPLLWAARKGHGAVCKLLIEKNALIDARDYKGYTPLFYTIVNHREAICKLLLENKASIDVEVNNGRSLLYYAMALFRKAECKLLIDMQLAPARKNKAAIKTFLGIARKRLDNLPCFMPYDVAKMIARYAFETVQRDNLSVIEQIEKSGNLELIPQLSEYVRTNYFVE